MTRIESNLRRLEGVRSVRSSLAAGTVTVLWQPGVRLDLPRLKAAVLRWRGAVRYGGASVAVTGTLEASPTAIESGGWVLRAAGTRQPFRLRMSESAVGTA